MAGSSSTTPPVTSTRRAETGAPSAVATVKEPSLEVTSVTRPDASSTPYDATSPRPISTSSRGLMPSRPR